MIDHSWLIVADFPQLIMAGYLTIDSTHDITYHYFIMEKKGKLYKYHSVCGE